MSDPNGAEKIHGQVTFEWMDGRSSMIQYVDLDSANSLEIIDYDEESNCRESYYIDAKHGKPFAIILG